ncbi:MAG: metal-dependent hydrolase [Verrucomicrobia bacterium]|nr:metal-dependent hydrolase [Verrucomicrobiota bacterium]
MSPITHLLISWNIANLPRHSSQRDRALVTLAGIVPDLDGVGLVAEGFTRNAEEPLLWWTHYHHVAAHNLTAALAVTALAALLANGRRPTALLAGIAFHLHLVCDVIGSRGADGYPWPIAYFWPFSNSILWTWSGQWSLNAWPNFAITAVALTTTLLLGWRRGYSPLELMSSQLDQRFVAALRQRFPRASDPVAADGRRRHSVS